MKKFEVIAISIIIVLAIAATTIAVFDLLSPPKQGQTNPSSHFIEQPVVDVIIPSLFKTEGSNNVNIPINISAGQTMTFAVDVYTTVSLNLTMDFRIFAPFGQASNSSVTTTESGPRMVVASFNPETLTIHGSSEGSSNMTLAVSNSATPGDYSSVVSAVNLDDSSQVWGDFIQINITD